MELKGKKYLVLYLTDWQKRMIKDFLKIDCHTWMVPIDGGNVKYGVGIRGNKKVKRMYLDDWQIREMKDEAGVSCEFIELDDDQIHMLYGVPTGV